jgi:GNAT superfamily N-acetyltransferase
MVNLPPGCRLTAERHPDENDIEALELGLDDYNRGFLGDTGYARIALFVRDKSGEIRAGLDGMAYAQWLFVKLLWVHADLRRGGIGSGLLAEAERRAVAHGCHSVWLDTFSFQAPQFYKKLGYLPFGTIELPPGHRRIFLQKPLVRG